MSQIFEFHFNPAQAKGKGNKIKDLVFDSFCFEPTNIYEKRMGSLYLIGSLKNVFPENGRFLDILAEKIKEKYYKEISITPEESLKESLKSANEHLDKVIKNGDVSWLGNLSFGVISIKNFELNFTKTGELKVILLRNKEVIDIDQNLNFEEIEPYPLKVFGNIISGKLIENDILLILSNQTYQAFLEENLFKKIASRPAKKAAKIIGEKKEKLSKISGICLLIGLNEKDSLKEKETFKEKKSFQLPLFKKNYLIKERLLNLRPKKIKINFLKISNPKIKNIVIVLLLAFFLFIGFYIFEKREELMIKNYQTQIYQIEQKIIKATQIEKDVQSTKKANQLYQEAWNEINSLKNNSVKAPLTVKNQISEMKNNLYQKLAEISKLTIIEEPELIFEFQIKEYAPRKLILFKESLFLYHPNSNNIFDLEKKEIIETDQKINSATIFYDSIIFFSKPNQLIILENNQIKEKVYLEEISSNFDLSNINSYFYSLYFLEAEKNLIIKYPYLSKLKWKSPELWLSSEVIVSNNLISVAIDGSIWALNDKNRIKKYHNGRLEKIIDLEIFPEPKKFSKIFTSLNHSHIYISEPAEKRIIILNKNGEIVKQLRSEKFNNIFDFAVSQNEKEIYILNGLTLYQINL